jgi:dinuclear metal center YbgI/SA1388 family protein
MASLNTIVEYTNTLLDISQFSDYCPNGLQLQGKSEVQCLIGGVTASRDLIDSAIDAGADAILVHHGYFWKGEQACITGIKYERIRRLIDAGISLLAYHLPLDAHAEYGNNVQLARQMGFAIQGGFARHGTIDIACYGQLSEGLSAASLAERLHAVLRREPLYIQGHDREIQRLGWCTGAAQGYIEEAAALGLDAFISGEVSEHTWHVARELGIDYFAAGHHATERYGVMALGEHLSERFSLEFSFKDLFNPV